MVLHVHRWLLSLAYNDIFLKRSSEPISSKTCFSAIFIPVTSDILNVVYFVKILVATGMKIAGKLVNEVSGSRMKSIMVFS